MDGLFTQRGKVFMGLLRGLRVVLRRPLLRVLMLSSTLNMFGWVGPVSILASYVQSAFEWRQGKLEALAAALTLTRILTLTLTLTLNRTRTRTRTRTLTRPRRRASSPTSRATAARSRRARRRGRGRV